MAELLNVQGLKTQFKTKEGTVHAVNGVSFQLSKGETLAIVGESGCGKSVSVMSMLKLIPTPPGKIIDGKAIYQGKDLLKMTKGQIRKIRGAEIGMVFQDPMTSFNPLLTIGRQLTEPLEIHYGMSRHEGRKKAVDALEMVGIPNAKARLNNYPHQFSGGMRQRVMVAMALICSPEILIADEPTTALDVTIQAQIVDLVKRLSIELGMAVIWITHDLGIVAGLADRINVMYAGYVIEAAKRKPLYSNPQHPYTVGLLDSLPRIDETGHKRLASIEGLPPVLLKEPQFCPFSNRCKFVKEKCKQENPPLIPIANDHFVACWVDINTGEIRQ